MKYMRAFRRAMKQESHPAWGAWIEIKAKTMSGIVNLVAPRMGCVD